ncbi:hypothetical protein V2A60_008435 [Cordyceps javanica]
MASAVTHLEYGLKSDLESMLSRKAPGASRSRINRLTTLCVANVESEAVLIPLLHAHFRKTPDTHKLSVLYVIDSVVRAWLLQARARNQDVSRPAPDGTHVAAGKIIKLLDIQKMGKTFPAENLRIWRQGLTVPPHAAVHCTPPDHAALWASKSGQLGSSDSEVAQRTGKDAETGTCGVGGGPCLELTLQVSTNSQFNFIGSLSDNHDCRAETATTKIKARCPYSSWVSRHPPMALVCLGGERDGIDTALRFGGQPTKAPVTSCRRARARATAAGSSSPTTAPVPRVQPVDTDKAKAKMRCLHTSQAPRFSSVTLTCLDGEDGVVVTVLLYASETRPTQCPLCHIDIAQ